MGALKEHLNEDAQAKAASRESARSFALRDPDGKLGCDCLTLLLLSHLLELCLDLIPFIGCAISLLKAQPTATWI